ncbi:head maturation protease, ClpP-related [uncultured Enterovirga sp.]|uniref:head maturation protease, ClpP-related n=1 Tax=uncultured Enterovirga sp. TaxID=2026352 RepID=UPI0035C9E889
MADEKTRSERSTGDAKPDRGQLAGRAKLLPGSAEFPRPELLKRPRGVLSRIKARDERPAALPMPSKRNITAFTPAEVFEKWSAEAAGVRSVARDDNVITMFAPIGEDFWSGEGVTAKRVTAQLRAIGDRPVEVHINSPGGDMFEGIAIYNVLREHPSPVTIKVMGIAASAASVIAMAGNTVEVGAASFLMIHNCSVLAAGNRHDFLEVASFLEPFDQAMAEVYAARSGQDVKACTKWMDDETYMSGSLAVQRGFADALLPADQVITDPGAKASDQATNKLRAMELILVSHGKTRTEARAAISEIKGTPGAVPEATPGAGAEDWSGLTRALATLRT